MAPTAREALRERLRQLVLRILRDPLAASRNFALMQEIQSILRALANYVPEVPAPRLSEPEMRLSEVEVKLMAQLPEHERALLRFQLEMQRYALFNSMLANLNQTRFETQREVARNIR